jgi:hypothetical protein
LGKRRGNCLALFGVLAVLFCAGRASAQAYQWKPVVIGCGGFVTGIITHPNAAGVMYCRTDIGGAYRWNPATDSWIPLQDFLGWKNEEWSLMGIESLALDPQDPDRIYMTCGWLGAGRRNEIFISTDRGATFTRVVAPFTLEANAGGRGNGERLAVDPNLGSILFNATRKEGLWKSTDHGATWTKVSSFPLDTTANSNGLVFVEFIKGSGTLGNPTPEIWVGVSQDGNNLYRSTDGGATWTAIAGGAPAGDMPQRASQDGQGNMYVTFSNGIGPNDVTSGVVRKFDLATQTSGDVTPQPTGQGGFSGVSVDRQQPNVVVVSTLDRWWPGDEIYRSTDGGAHWTALYQGATVDVSSAPWAAFHGSTARPWWIADVKIDPFNSDRVYHVGGGGLYSSYNLTSAKPSWEFRSEGIEETAFVGGGTVICSPPSGARLLSAMGDIGGFTHYDLDVSPPDADYYNPVYGQNSSVDFAALNPSIIVRTHSGTSHGSRSTDAGSTWTDFATHPAAADANGVGAIAISADGSRLVWSSPGFAPSYSTDNGATWNTCAGNVTPGSQGEQALIASDRVNPQKFYLYMPSTGVVHISTDGGASFSAGATVGMWGNALSTAYGQEGDVWVACDNGNASTSGLWRSTDSGASFGTLAGLQTARSVGFGRSADGAGYPAIYIFGEIGDVWGMYRSEDQGAHWTRINDDAHQYGAIAQVTGDPRIYGRCYVAASGRGILYGDIVTQPPPAASRLAATAANGGISLTWQTAIGATSYVVKRGTASGGPYETVATGVLDASFLDTGLVNGQTYDYVVAAANAYGVAADSNEASATWFDKRALYAFEGNAQDTSGNGFHGTATAVSYVAGKVGAQAAQFDGSSSFVSIPSSVTGDFTVALWMKTTDTAGSAGAQWWAGRGVVDGEVSGGAADWGTSVVSGKFVFGVGSPGGDVSVTSSTSVNDGQWHHVAATRDTASGAMQVYVDGVLRGSGVGPTGARTAPASLRIGGILTGVNFLNGTLDDVRLYDRVLSASEVAELAGPAPAEPTGVTAQGGNAQVSVSWSAAAGATQYILARAMTAGGPYAVIATLPGTNFVDSGLADGVAYHYVVRAMNLAGTSGDSSEASATTYTALEKWRLANFGAIANTGDAADGADPDGDGWVNAQEFAAGTNPKDGGSFLKIVAVTQSGGDVLVSFASVAGKTYRLESSSTLQGGSWSTVQDPIAGTGGAVQVADPGAAAQAKRFYRVTVLP